MSTAPASSLVPPMSTPMVRRPGMTSLYAQMPNDLEQRPYKLYRAAPRGLKARLRGEEELAFRARPAGSDGGRNGDQSDRRRRFGGFTWKKGLLYLAMRGRRRGCWCRWCCS